MTPDEMADAFARWFDRQDFTADRLDTQRLALAFGAGALFATEVMSKPSTIRLCSVCNTKCVGQWLS